MKGWFVFPALASLVFPVLAANPKAEKIEPEIVEEIIAKVNGAIVTRGDLARSQQSLVADMKRRKVSDEEIQKSLNDRKDHLLRDKIDNLLLTQRGDQMDINVDKEVSKYMADLMLQFKVADADKFSALVRQQTGMRFEDFKLEVKNGILTQRVLGQEVGSRIVIPRAEVEQYYEEHKEEFKREERVFLREILIATEGDDDEAAKAKADDIVTRGRRGEKFDELAREASAAVTADNGGWLGGWKKGDLKKEIEDIVWDKDKNYVTDPLKVDNGYLVLKVLEHHQAGIAHIEEVENEIMGKLYQPRFEPKVREFLTLLRQQAYLQIKEGWVDSAAAPDKDTTWTDPAKLTPDTVTKEEVMARTGRKRLLWLIPIPGTKRSPKSSSK